jgi:hypothetical protein
VLLAGVFEAGEGSVLVAKGGVDDGDAEPGDVIGLLIEEAGEHSARHFPPRPQTSTPVLRPTEFARKSILPKRFFVRLRHFSPALRNSYQSR